MSKIVLGIETSCDDTAAAIVTETGEVLSSVVVSQNEMHAQFGGVYPEFAGRAHVSAILPAIHRAFEEANVTPQDIEAIGVTRGPGLIGSLLVGLHTANALAMCWNKPVIGINHLRGHLRSAELNENKVTYPAVILLVSGGHTFLAYMESPTEIKLLGSTRDDSVGEAYDKVARMLDLGFPGGPVIDKAAFKGSPNIDFPRPMRNQGLEFSFSGLKAAVARYLAGVEEFSVEDVSASFVESVMDVLVHKCRKAIKEYQPASLVVVGGVAASPQLRAAAQDLCDRYKIELCLPPIRWSTDNAAMIALATWDYIKRDIRPAAKAQLQLSIEEF